MKTNHATVSLQLNLPTVAIVVPAYNAVRTITECLQSLESLNYPKSLYKILVVDNRSTDATRDIAKGYPVTLLTGCGRQSSYAARNAGIRQSSAHIVAFTDADCIADPDWLLHLVSPFESQQVGATTGCIMGVRPSTPVERFISDIGLLEATSSVPDWPIMLTANAAVRRSCLYEVGLFNDSLYTGADVDLGWRLYRQLGLRVVHVPGALIMHRHRATVPTMYKQFRRHGFGEILLDAMYQKESNYFRPASVQANRMLKQTMACLNYVRAFLMRSVSRAIGRCSQQRQMTAFYWLVAEGGNLIGKLQGLWITRFFQRDPRLLAIEDPKER